MPRNGMAIVVLFALVGSGVVYHTLTNVNDGDVAAFNNVPLETNGLFVKAGDIVALARDGRNPERICRTNADRQLFEVQPTNAVYVNGLAKQLPPFTTLVGFVSGVMGSDNGQSQPDSVTFAGTIMRTPPESQKVSDACSCEIARRLARKELACTTVTAMISIGNEYAQAVRFKRESIVVLPSQFEQCGIKPVDLGTLPPCDQFGSVPWDVALRRFLNLVERQEVRDRPVAGISHRSVGSL